MMDSELEKTLSALREADAAGDVESAKRLASIASSFSSTEGGAALGNPNIQRQGDKALRPDQQIGTGLATIGGAGLAGGMLGAAAPELLGAAATGVRMLPLPGAPAIATGIDFAGKMARLAGRPSGAIAGAIGGLTGETAGQLAEASGAPEPVPFVARFLGGGVSGEAANAARSVLQKYARVPALGLMSKFKHETAKWLLEKLQSPVGSISAKEEEFVRQIEAEIRGGQKTDQPLQQVGNLMEAEAKRLLQQAETGTTLAARDAGKVGGAGEYPAMDNTLSNIGGKLQSRILERHKGALEARRSQYAQNETERNAAVAQQEQSGVFPRDMPEYSDIVSSLEDQIKPGGRSPDVANSFKQILSSIRPQDEKSPATFQAIDDVRRQLGEVFRGKPPVGYEGIDAATARKYYGKLSDLQKSYAGDSQSKLLDEYAASTPGLEIFSSKLGKKVTALDQYREGQYPDPSAIPSSFFKTSASVKALKELTGNDAQVNEAALQYANHELSGKDSSAVRSWLSKNSEWLSETGVTRALISGYASRLEASERSMRNALEFSKQAERNSSILVGKKLPAQRAVDLIKSGDTEIWSMVTPAIVKSPQAKMQMVSAVRQVVADQVTAKGVGNIFDRNIRGFLETSGISTKAEMDAISQKLENVRTMKMPDDMRLGLAKRIVLNSIGGYTAGVASRAAVGGYGLLQDMVPE